MAERDLWCQGVATRTWHLVCAGAAQGVCGRGVAGMLWPLGPGIFDRTCRSCVRIARASGLAATQPAPAAEPVDPAANWSHSTHGVLD
jgi:hypothetical protein